MTCKMRYGALILIALLLAIPGLSFAAGEAAPSAAIGKFYNPQPVKDDFVLPMPCGGQMVFRRVTVPSDGLLGDRRIVVGGSDDRFRLLENPRAEYLAGAFSDPSLPGQRFYYIGKYEVTQQQYQALSGTCPPAPSALSPPPLPVTSVSWFDAVLFTEKYTEWLLQNAAAKLPKNENAVAFVRLPTETEWEYAARGGAAVKDADFLEPVFPMKEPLARYAWYQSTQSANGKLQPIGLLLPNPLGLHDILGNADEMVLDQFRLNKLSRSHGQAGGFVAKGGNFLTSEADIRNSYRQEIPYYDASGARKIRTLGFRLAISSVVITSPKRLEALNGEWSKLPESATLVGPVQTGDPVAELTQLTKATTDIEMRKRLDSLSTVLTANISARNEQRDRAAKGTLRLGAFLIIKLKDDNKLLLALRSLNAAQQKMNLDEQVRLAAEQKLQAAEKATVENLGYYTDTVVSAAQDYPQEVLERQLGVFASEMATQNLASVADLAKLYLSHIDDYRRAKKADRNKWLKDITS